MNNKKVGLNQTNQKKKLPPNPKKSNAQISIQSINNYYEIL